MKVRICTAIVGIIAVLVLVWLGSWPFTAACVAAGIISFREYSRKLMFILSANRLMLPSSSCFAHPGFILYLCSLRQYACALL